MNGLIQVTAGRREQPFHYHEELILFLLLRGEADGIFNNETSRLKAGGIWLVNPEVIYSLADCSEDAVWLQVSMDLKKFEAYLPGITTEYFKCGPAQNDAPAMDLKDEIRGRMCSLLRLLSGERPDEKTKRAVLYACLEILNDLKLGFTMTVGHAGDDRYGENYARYWRMLDYIYDHCNRKLTLKEIADSEHISEVYTSKILRKVGGYNFSDTTALVRAECSIRYLLESDMSISEIAYECGFSAPRYYNAAFQKFCQCSPGEYREKIRGTVRYREGNTGDALLMRDGITAGELSGLLLPFQRDTYLAWEAIRIQITPAMMDLPLKQCENPYKKNVLCCTEQDLLLGRQLEKMSQCREELGMTKLYVHRPDGGELSAAARENIAWCGMTLLKGHAAGSGILLEELFAENSIRKPMFYIRKIFNTAGLRYEILQENAFLYIRQGDDAALHLLLFNDSGKHEKRFGVSFDNFETAQPYVLKITEFQNGHEPAGEMAGLRPELAAGLTAPREELRLVERLQGYKTEVTVGRGQAALIDLIPGSDRCLL